MTMTTTRSSTSVADSITGVDTQTSVTKDELSDDDANLIVEKTLRRVELFYRKDHPEIKESHGLSHIMTVYHHAEQAVQVHSPSLSPTQRMMVLVASLLHDTDDRKYFPTNTHYENASTIMNQVVADDKTNNDNNNSSSLISPSCQATIIQLISFVSCSKNKNSVPPQVTERGDDDNGDKYWMLIPRWSDRLEAVGRRGVVRCYQYSQESNPPEKLCDPQYSPRATTPEEVWKIATLERFENYDGHSTDMISHYYDKLLQVSRPPPSIVRNSYLEQMALESSRELMEVCIRYGRTGVVDEHYIQSLAGMES